MNPHYVVVGGSRGLGRVLARAVSSQGGWASVISRTAVPEPHANWSQAETQGIAHFPCDVTEQSQIARTFEKISGERGPIDGVVFCPRFRGAGDDWDGELAISLTASRDVLEASVGHLRSGGDRSVVLVSSGASQFVSPTASVGYHVAKAGMCQLARYYAVKFGERGIRVNTVCPGSFVKPESENYFQTHPDIARTLAQASPLKRMGTSMEVVEAILFLLSPKASFITGQSLFVDGGVSLKWQEHLG